MKKSSILAAITGNIIEWYDFTLYIFLAPVLAKVFFAQNSHLEALLLTFLVFALGFFIRPLGSILFGHLGDKLGRATTLKISILLLSIPTIGIGLLPSHASIGLSASLAFAGLRLLQGLCIGGEFAGSMIYLSEMAAPNQRAFMSCMANNGSNFGILCASLIAAGTTSLFSAESFLHYAWRIPFIFGGLIGLLGLWLRRDILETYVFQNLAEQNKTPATPLWLILKTHKKDVLKIFLLLVFSATGSYVLMNFMSDYLHEYFHYSLAGALKIQSTYNALTFLLVTLAGLASDRYGRRPMLLIAAFGYILFSIPCFYLLKTQGLWLALFPLVIFYCLEQASTPILMVEMFPAKARYTGISLGYNLAMALVGGTAPFVNTWLISKFHEPLILAYYLIAGAVISLSVIWKSLPATFGKDRTLMH